MSCPFCAIANDKDAKLIPFEAPSAATYDVFAFHARDPVAPVHIIVTSGYHNTFESWDDTCIDELGEMLDAAVQVGKQHAPNGFRIVVNSGSDAGQTVEHVHIHVIGGRRLGEIG